jgi:hypothetical protein
MERSGGGGTDDAGDMTSSLLLFQHGQHVFQKPSFCLGFSFALFSISDTSTILGVCGISSGLACDAGDCNVDIDDRTEVVPLPVSGGIYGNDAVDTTVDDGARLCPVCLGSVNFKLHETLSH